MKVYAVNKIWAADLEDMKFNVNENNGYIKYYLNLIDCFSKFVWIVPLKSKRGDDVFNSLSKY